jgi:hypothetical protein
VFSLSQGRTSCSPRTPREPQQCRYIALVPPCVLNPDPMPFVIGGLPHRIGETPREPQQCRYIALVPPCVLNPEPMPFVIGGLPHRIGETPQQIRLRCGGRLSRAESVSVVRHGVRVRVTIAVFVVCWAVKVAKVRAAKCHDQSLRVN